MGYVSAADNADRAVTLAGDAERIAIDGDTQQAIAALAASVSHLAAAVAAISRGLHRDS